MTLFYQILYIALAVCIAIVEEGGALWVTWLLLWAAHK